MTYLRVIMSITKVFTKVWLVQRRSFSFYMKPADVRNLMFVNVRKLHGNQFSTKINMSGGQIQHSEV